MIGGDIEVKVLGIHGNQVKIGIKAPDDVHILRTELLDRARELEKADE
jgi:carbon storage regulator